MPIILERIVKDNGVSTLRIGAVHSVLFQDQGGAASLCQHAARYAHWRVASSRAADERRNEARLSRCVRSANNLWSHLATNNAAPCGQQLSQIGA
jgi:hypothetical protein